MVDFRKRAPANLSAGRRNLGFTKPLAEGRTSIGVADLVICLFTPSRRVLSSLLLLLALIAPYTTGLVAGLSGTDCSMSCCKRAKKCCCHKSGQGSADHGPHWKAAGSCPSNCKTSFGVTASFAPAVLSNDGAAQLPAANAPAIRSGHSRVYSGASLTPLYGRPPPAA